MPTAATAAAATYCGGGALGLSCLPACCCCCTALIISAAEPAAAGCGPYGGDLGGLLELQQDLEGGGGWCPCNSKSSQGFPVDTLMGWSCPWRRNRRAQQVRGGGRSCSVDCPEIGALQASRANLRSEAHRAGHHVKPPIASGMVHARSSTSAPAKASSRTPAPSSRGSLRSCQATPMHDLQDNRKVRVLCLPRMCLLQRHTAQVLRRACRSPSARSRMAREGGYRPNPLGMTM